MEIDKVEILKKIKSFLGKQNFTSIDRGLKDTVEWFKKYYKF